MSEPLIRTEGLVAGWSVAATVPVDLSLQAGEIVGLTGSNGVGKSTLLSAIAGRARILSGRLEIKPGLRLALQTQDIPPVDGLPLSGRELLAMTQAAADGLPAWLADRLDVRLDRLSGGQRHYLALWAVLMAPADVILLDEPTSSMDFTSEQQFKQRPKEIAAHKTVLIVTHRNSLLDLATRVIVVDDGRVVADGPRDQVIHALQSGGVGRAS